MRKIIFTIIVWVPLLVHGQNVFEKILNLPNDQLHEVFFPILNDGGEPEYYLDIDYDYGLCYGDYFMDIDGNRYPMGFAFGDHLQRLVVKENDGYNIYSTKGKIAGPFEHIEELGDFNRDNKTITNQLKFAKGNRFGVINTDGRILISALYDDIMIPEEGGLFIVKKNDKYGIVNSQNKEIQACIYDDIIPDQTDDNLLMVIRNGKAGYVDKTTGKTIVPCEYMPGHHQLGGELIKVMNEQEWVGFYDKTGRMIVPCKYSPDLFEMIAPSIYRMLMNKGKPGEYNPDSKYDLINKNGDVVLQGLSYAESISEKDGTFYYSIKDSLYVAINDNGDIRSINKYSEKDSIWIHPKKGTKYAVVEEGYKNKKYGIMDLYTGEYIIPLRKWYIDIYDVEVVEAKEDAILIVHRDNEHSFIRASDGKVISRLYNVKYLDKVPFMEEYHKTLYHVELYDERIGIIDSSGAYVIPLQECKYTETEINRHCVNFGFRPPYIYVGKDGLYDKNGEKLIEGGDFSDDFYDDLLMRCGGRCVTFFDNYYFIEDGEVTKVENVKSSLELIYQYFVRKSKSMSDVVDTKIPEGCNAKTNTYAFIIANENYPIQNVPFALNDGRIFAQYCIKTLGLKRDHVILYENATFGKLMECVEQMKNASKANDGKLDIIFYYAGHAFPDEESKTAWLLPVDGKINLNRTCYSLKQLYNDFADVNANSVVCFIDACFSGATLKKEGRGVAITVKDEIPPTGNIIVFTASTGNETAHQYQEKSHGLFTYYLLKKLQDSKGDVTLGELDEYITTNVKRASFEVNQNLQTPTVIKSLSFQDDEWKSIKLVK